MDNNVLAKIENIEITRQKMLQVMRNLPQQQAMEVSTEAGRRKLLDELVAGELLYLDAVEQKLDQDEEYLATLEEARRGLLQRYAIQKLLGSIQATTEEMTAFYEQNKEHFSSSESVSARHILVDNEDLAKSIKTEIENGLDFSEAAKKYSTCPSKENGGDLGTFEKGRMVPEFEKAAFELEIGQMSDLVKTQFGYHLIVVDAKLPQGTKTIDEVQSQLRQMVSEQKQGEVYYSKLDELKSKYTVEINEEALK